MPPKLIQSLAPSKIKRICGACNEEIRGTDIAKHYRTKTDFKILKHLKSFSKERAKKELKNIDCHTAFMFENDFSLTNLPTWKTHKPAKQDIPDMFKLIHLSKSNAEEEILGETSDDVNAIRNDQFKDNTEENEGNLESLIISNDITEEKDNSEAIEIEDTLDKKVKVSIGFLGIQSRREKITIPIMLWLNHG